MHSIALAIVLALMTPLGACTRPGGGEAHQGTEEEMQEVSASSAEIEPRMVGHVRGMRTMSGEDLNAMIPAHRQMAVHFLDEMDHEVRSVRSRPDARWVATLDSVRRDLNTMGTGSRDELKANMDAHGVRILRLVDMHRHVRGGGR